MAAIDRQQTVRATVLRWAHADPCVAGAAITGSQARGTADRWSDVDLLFVARPDCDLTTLLDAWTTRLDDAYGVVHHFDLPTDTAVYRAHLLHDLLEVDIGVTDQRHFAAIGDQAFTLVFSTAHPPRPVTGPDHRSAIGHAWHRILHARICVARHRPLQALYWANAFRQWLRPRPTLAAGAVSARHVLVTALYACVPEGHGRCRGEPSHHVPSAGHHCRIASTASDTSSRHRPASGRSAA